MRCKYWAFLISFVVDLVLLFLMFRFPEAGARSRNSSLLFLSLSWGFLYGLGAYLAGLENPGLSVRYVKYEKEKLVHELDCQKISGMI